MIKSYEDLDVYNRAYKLSLTVHKITQKFPDIEKYELGSQLRRAAISVTLNIVEGYGRKESKAEFQHFLRTALGSCNETRVLLKISKDLGYIEQAVLEKLQEDYEIISKQLYKLRHVWK